MIELVDFTKEYKTFFNQKKTAAHNVSFVAKPKSITGLLGPNGAGKTTVIKAICSIHYATSGSVYIYDSNKNKFDAALQVERAKRLIGYVSENPHLYRNYSVLEYLKMTQEIWNCTDGESLRKVIEMFGLGDVLKQKISTLSKGFCQRVNFAASLIHDPEVLVLDEPASGLDPVATAELYSIIKTLNDEDKITVIMISHDTECAKKYAKKILHLATKQIFYGSKEDYMKTEIGRKFLEEINF